MKLNVFSNNWLFSLERENECILYISKFVSYIYIYTLNEKFLLIIYMCAYV